MSFQTIINNYLYNIRKTHAKPNTSVEREGTTLSDIEIRQYQQILVAVAETINIMAELDIESDK